MSRMCGLIWESGEKGKMDEVEELCLVVGLLSGCWDRSKRNTLSCILSNKAVCTNLTYIDLH
jgi:hypothetical protein